MDNIEASLASIDARLESIDGHLDKLNGSVEKNNERARKNEKDIAVMQANVSHIDKDSTRTEERVWDFVKRNGVAAGQLGGLVFVIGKVSGWW